MCVCVYCDALCCNCASGADLSVYRDDVIFSIVIHAMYVCLIAGKHQGVARRKSRSGRKE